MSAGFSWAKRICFPKGGDTNGDISHVRVRVRERGRMLIWVDQPEPERRERFRRELEFVDQPEPICRKPSRVDPPEPHRGRIRWELKTMWVDPPPFCRPGPSPVTDLFQWEVVIDGPDGTPYAGGTFPVNILIFGDYPMKQPPRITFKTKIFHPNIDFEGEVFMDILQREHWSPLQSVGTLLTSIVSVLYDPMLDYPINGEAADLYENDIEQYEEVAMAWTWKYSSTPVASYYYPVKAKEDKPLLDCCDAVADKEEERLRCREAYERLRCREAYERRRKAEEEERLAAAEECKQGQIKGRSSSGNAASLLWRRVLMFLR